MNNSLDSKVHIKNSAYYSASIDEFVSAGEMSIIGILSSSSAGAVDQEQIDAWREEVGILQLALIDLEGAVFFEFSIPRLGGRIDVVVLTGGALFPIEFKVGERQFLRSDYEQAWDYALDLKNFHEASHSADLFPILCATKATAVDKDWKHPHSDGVRPPIRANAANLQHVIQVAIEISKTQKIITSDWGKSAYCPTPTIIQAARSLFGRHSVEDISRSDAGAKNLRITSKRVEQIIDQSRSAMRKAIVFVTGVPGAGKTLVGLNVATMREDKDSPTHTVFLSGNGPLVAVLQESLVRDEMERLKKNGEKPRKGDVAQKVKPFIQNVHHFRDDGVRDRVRAPADHVVIFDEAQRAWNLEKTVDFMRRKKKVLDFSQSEPDFLIGYLDRHIDWAVVVCLVGGGQEIHTGEAGIGAWLEAIDRSYPHWDVFISSELGGSEYDASSWISDLKTKNRLSTDPDLHLSVSMRSFRSEKVSGFVKAVLDIDAQESSLLLAEVLRRYPIVRTRDLNRAKEWVRKQARGTERFGLLASSQGYRLKPHAIDVRVPVDPVHWFLDGPDDVRSSFYLEDVVTEFQVQGLELDWTCVTWDADMRFDKGAWSHHSFRGNRWTRVHKDERKRYMLNAYRVLLTRARQGMVIFVPPGDGSDHTRLPEFYDGVWGWLEQVGVHEL